MLPAGWMEPIRGGQKPGRLRNKPGHSRHAGELLLVLLLQADRMPPWIGADQGRAEHRCLMGCRRGCGRTLVARPGWRTRSGRGREEHEVLRQAAAGTAGRIRGSQRRRGRGRGKPWLLKVIRGERRDADGENGVRGRTRATLLRVAEVQRPWDRRL